MAEKGQVLKVNGTTATIKMTRTEACAKCRACVAGMKKEDMLIEAQNQCSAKINDWVEVELQGNAFILAALVAYGLPLLCFLAGLGGGYFLLSRLSISPVLVEIGSFLFGMVLTMVAFFGIRSQEKRWASQRYRPVASKITTP